MLETAAHLSSLPIGALAVVGLVALAQLALDVIALADLFRRPLDQVALGNRWLWVAIILLVNLVGAILYLAIGRRPQPLTDSTGSVRRDAGTIRNVVDSLYGPEQKSRQP